MLARPRCAFDAALASPFWDRQKPRPLSLIVMRPWRPSPSLDGFEIHGHAFRAGMLDGIGDGLVEQPKDLDDVPGPQVRTDRQACRRWAPATPAPCRAAATGPAARSRQTPSASIRSPSMSSIASITSRRSRSAARAASPIGSPVMPRLALAFAERDDADELAAEAVVQVAHQPGALGRQRRGAGQSSLRWRRSTRRRASASRSSVTVRWAKPSTSLSALAKRQVRPTPIAISSAE